jgi:hypothetical protein
MLYVLPGRIHGRTCGRKWSLLKVRGGNYKREHDGAQLESGGREDVCFSSPDIFKAYANVWEGRNQVIPI